MYELRVPANYSFGQLTNPAAISDTTMVSTDFASLPSGLPTSLYIPITLQDPANNNFEIVSATAHTGASNTISVVRGREGSTSRAWPASTLWACAPTGAAIGGPQLPSGARRLRSALQRRPQPPRPRRRACADDDPNVIPLAHRFRRIMPRQRLGGLLSECYPAA
ncbi:hypothetical protein AB0M80_28385 [Amycolatopsis sp. NPDC051045]|uniref:hypothetical protein n=1 Tax=Amycolatopsis sp. NPDC051045 TaxID=3156922 RepID=UPI00341F7A7C